MFERASIFVIATAEDCKCGLASYKLLSGTGARKSVFPATSFSAVSFATGRDRHEVLGSLER